MPKGSKVTKTATIKWVEKAKQLLEEIDPQMQEALLVTTEASAKGNVIFVDGRPIPIQVFRAAKGLMEEGLPAAPSQKKVLQSKAGGRKSLQQPITFLPETPKVVVSGVKHVSTILPKFRSQFVREESPPDTRVSWAFITHPAEPKKNCYRNLQDVIRPESGVEQEQKAETVSTIMYRRGHGFTFSKKKGGGKMRMDEVDCKQKRRKQYAPEASAGQQEDDGKVHNREIMRAMGEEDEDLTIFPHVPFWEWKDPTQEANEEDAERVKEVVNPVHLEQIRAKTIVPDCEMSHERSQTDEMDVNDEHEHGRMCTQRKPSQPDIEGLTCGAEATSKACKCASCDRHERPHEHAHRRRRTKIKESRPKGYEMPDSSMAGFSWRWTSPPKSWSVTTPYEASAIAASTSMIRRKPETLDEPVAGCQSLKRYAEESVEGERKRMRIAELVKESRD
ncbi:hypothetical protein HDV00_003849 [Rhizophlyctis rosea]|nr:hypothetical protein HDV00_003849 [Rhizophlyctis rosea]